LRKELIVGTVTAKPGEKAHGFLNVGMRLDGSSVGVPVIIVNGTEDGAILEVDAGQHGDEYEGAEAIIKVSGMLDPKKMRGAFIGVPAVNVPAFEEGSRVSHVASYGFNTDINRIYPGKDWGWITEKIANLHVREIISKADYVISFHGGGNYVYLTPIVGYTDLPGERGRKEQEFAKSLGWDLLWKEHADESTVLYPGALGDYTLLKTNKFFLIPEWGGQSVRRDHRQAHVDMGVKGVVNAMEYLGILDGKPSLPESWTILETKGKTLGVSCRHAGIIHHECKPRDIVNKGTTLSRITNYFGEEIDCLEAPYDDCMVVGLWDYPTVKIGTWSVFTCHVEGKIK
jgi:predicted deacylase